MAAKRETERLRRVLGTVQVRPFFKHRSRFSKGRDVFGISPRGKRGEGTPWRSVRVVLHLLWIIRHSQLPTASFLRPSSAIVSDIRVNTRYSRTRGKLSSDVISIHIEPEVLKKEAGGFFLKCRRRQTLKRKCEFEFQKQQVILRSGGGSHRLGLEAGGWSWWGPRGW